MLSRFDLSGKCGEDVEEDDLKEKRVQVWIFVFSDFLDILFTSLAICLMQFPEHFR